MKTYYFDTTSQSLTQLEEVFDFLWPTATALWNLRWQVRGFLDAADNASDPDLAARFVLKSGINGANLRKACVDQTWDHQQDQLAKILIVNIFAIHESWIHEMLVTLGKSSIKLEKELQFPTSTNNGKPFGVWNAINILTTPESPLLRNAFYGTFSANPKYSGNKLNNLMKCYRYFKEIRNVQMHNGGIVNGRCESAYKEFALVATPSNLGVKEVPQHMPAVSGQEIGLNLRGVVGFSDVMIRLVYTIDAELSRSQLAETEFERRWRDHHAKKYTLKSDPDLRSRQISRYVKALGFPRPGNGLQFETFIKQHSLAN